MPPARVGRDTGPSWRKCRVYNASIVTESTGYSPAKGGKSRRVLSGLGTILQGQDCRRAAAGRAGVGRTLCFAVSGGRRGLFARSRRRRGRTCASRRSRILRGLRFLFQPNDVLVGNFPSEMLFRTSLLEMLLQKDGTARIRHKCAGRRQKDVSGAVLHFNPAPKKG
jgi:hypothetical protein